MSEQYCFGCGVKLQSTDKEKMGYTPKSSLESDDTNILCQRCFRLRNYNDIIDVEFTNDDFLKILNKIGEEDALILKVVDIFDFSGSWINGINRHTGNSDIILVGNKVDLLPKSVNHNKLDNWMRRMAKTNGTKPLDVCLLSSIKGHGVDDLMDKIDQYRNGRNVYVVGCTNVGKSSLINQIIKKYTNEQEDIITTSHFPGTTLDIIEIPLDDDKYIIDTPGIINSHQYAHYLNKESLKAVTPKKEIKATINQLNPEQSLFIGGLARIDFVEGERTSFVSYFANSLKIHRTKLQKADDLFKNHYGEMLTPPTKEETEKMPKFVKHHFKTKSEKMDIVISGLGWVSLYQEDTKITVHAPEGVGVYIRPSII